MERVINLVKTHKIELLLLIIYVFTTIVLMQNHEMWRDETQPWCLVRDCNFSEFIKIIKIEGHPIFWHLIIFPFVKLGVSAVSMQFAGLFISYCAAAYMLFKSPFNKITKFLVVMSSAMVYLYPIVVRNFVLIPIILFILADIYDKRKEHPYWFSTILILLSNTHFLVLCFCFINMLIFAFELIKERKKALISIGLFILNGIYLYYFYHSSLSESQSYYTYSQNTLPILDAISNFSMIFFQYPFINPYINIFLFYSLFSVIFFRIFKISKKVFSILLFAFIAHFYIYYKVWFDGAITQKAYLLLFILLFCYWITNKIKRDVILDIVVSAIFLINAIFSIYNVKFEVLYNYSGAKEAAKYIKNNLNEEQVFCTVGYAYLFTSISAYLPDKKFFSINENKYTSYYDFSRIKKINRNKIPDCKYYVVQKTLEPAAKFKLIYETTEPILSGMGYENKTEAFKIYQKE